MFYTAGVGFHGFMQGSNKYMILLGLIVLLSLYEEQTFYPIRDKHIYHIDLIITPTPAGSNVYISVLGFLTF